MRTKRSLISDTLYSGFIVATCLLGVVMTVLTGASPWVRAFWGVGIAGTLLCLVDHARELRSDEPKRMESFDPDWM